jgi:excisionase family DNA binding protein
VVVNEGGGLMAMMKSVPKNEMVQIDGFVVQSILMSIPEAARSLRLSRAKVYQLIALEGLPVVRFGRAVRVCRSSLEQWVQLREQGM